MRRWEATSETCLQAARMEFSTVSKYEVVFPCVFWLFVDLRPRSQGTTPWVSVSDLSSDEM